MSRNNRFTTNSLNDLNNKRIIQTRGGRKCYYYGNRRYRRCKGKSLNDLLISMNPDLYCDCNDNIAIISGDEAGKILEESKIKQSRKGKENAKVLLNFFNKILEIN